MVEDLFKDATGKETKVLDSYIQQLPDFDFDIPGGMNIAAGTRLTLNNGKPHTVAFSLIDLPWSLTKQSADRLGVPHVDLLPNSTIAEMEVLGFDKVDTPTVWGYILTHVKELYHIHNWEKEYHKLTPKTPEELATFIGIIRPGVRKLFLDRGLEIIWPTFHPTGESRTLGRTKYQIIFQEDMLELIQHVFKVDATTAEFIRSNESNISHLKEDSRWPDGGHYWDLFVSLFNELNPHLLSKGHCLQVALIILNQAYKLK